MRNMKAIVYVNDSNRPLLEVNGITNVDTIYICKGVI
jgi:hypothetical protein